MSNEELFEVEYFIPRRGGPIRGGKRNGLMFTVKWKNYDEVSDEPIENFIELGEEAPIHDNVVDYIIYYHNVAISYPYHYRKCICCDKRVRNGRIICKGEYCTMVYDCMKNVYDTELL